ncbi:hypothetical protein Taro_044799, partial [Colocasia esculenta]|nr:hypothetical protein [Colocasia esculenta]
MSTAAEQLSQKCVYRFCLGSVDTPLTGVDTVLQTLRQNEEEKVISVDTSPRFQRSQLTGLLGSVDTGSSSVDTRPSSQKTYLAVLDSVSTLPEVVLTLVCLPREPLMPVWDSVSTHSEVVSTHFG